MWWKRQGFWSGSMDLHKPVKSSTRYRVSESVTGSQSTREEKKKEKSGQFCHWSINSEITKVDKYDIQSCICWAILNQDKKSLKCGIEVIFSGTFKIHKLKREKINLKSSSQKCLCSTSWCHSLHRKFWVNEQHSSFWQDQERGSFHGGPESFMRTSAILNHKYVKITSSRLELAGTYKRHTRGGEGKCVLLPCYRGSGVTALVSVVSTPLCPPWACTWSQISACTSWCTPWPCASHFHYTQGPQDCCKLSTLYSSLRVLAGRMGRDKKRVKAGLYFCVRPTACPHPKP